MVLMPANLGLLTFLGVLSKILMPPNLGVLASFGVFKSSLTPFMSGVFAGVLAFLGVAFLAGVAFFGVTLVTLPPEDRLVGLVVFKGVSNNCFIASVMGVVIKVFLPPAFGVLNNLFMAAISGVVEDFPAESVKGDTNVSRGTLGVLIESKSNWV